MTYLLIFILSIILSAPYIIDICSGYLNYRGFDLQEFFLWHYASINNIVPYKDIFYPYGLLNYFKSYNLIYAFMYYLIVPVLFTIVFFIFRKIFKDKLILFSSFVIFYLFILILVGFQTFSRYGLLAVLSLYFSHIFYSATKIKINTLILLGIILGLFFSFINDQGIYLILSFIFMYLFGKYLQVKKEHFLSANFYLKAISEMLYIVFGFFIGIIPFFLFLLKIGNFYAFFDYLKDVREIVTVAKTPFFSFIDSPANIFTVVILYFALFYNFLKIFFFKHKFTLSSFLQVSLIFSILIMEQKSVVRSIDRQITFVSLKLLMLLVYEVINYLKNKITDRRITYFSFIIFVIILYSFNTNKQTINLPSLFRNYNLLVSNECFDNNLSFFSANNASNIEIIDLIKKQKNFNGKIFSFPAGDSAFYVLSNQKPPFYNAIFEGASYTKQNSVIQYIQDNEIEYVTLNTSKSSLQDGVPDYIRQSLLFKYILNNYYPFAVIGNHIILKKESHDFFASEILNQTKDYDRYLLDVYLYKIPFSEGLYKYKYLEKNNKLITESTDIDIINIFLKKRIFYSDNKVIVMIPSANNKLSDLNFIKFQLENEDNTTVYYNPCKANTQCIINLSKVPLFYKKRMITKIILNRTFEGKIKIFDLNNPGNLW